MNDNFFFQIFIQMRHSTKVDFNDALCFLVYEYW